MTISTTAGQQIFLGNGATNPFSFSLTAAPENATLAQALANLQLTYTDTSGNQTILSSGSYSIAFNANYVGGQVTYPLTGSPIANQTSLQLRRIVPFQQLTTIADQGDFAPTVIESALDSLELQIQQCAGRTGQDRGTWATGVVYNFGDIVIDGANGTNTLNYYVCIISNTSGTWSADLAAGDWTLFINIAGINSNVAAAAASATAAAGSAATATTEAGIATTQAGIATSAATTATTQAGIATTQATNAQNSATAAGNYAFSYSGTSTTSLVIGTGAKTFATQANKLWQPGQFLQAASNANANNYMHGTVTSYNGTGTLIMNITDIGGSGTLADWNISISGTQGPVGPAGSLGTTGTPTTGSLTQFTGATTIGNADLTGDVTTSGALATTISANAITTTKINNTAVTLAKIQNATANSVLLGSGASGSGASYAQIALGTGLSITGTTLNASTGATQLHSFNSGTSGTFTTSANITTATVFSFYIQGAGAGGGGTTATTGAAASGGGGGTCGLYIVSGLSPSTGYSFIIGSGSNGGTSSGTSAGNGANSTLTIGATTVTAFGGSGGTGSTTGSTAKVGQSPGGTATNATITLNPGSPGGNSISTAANASSVGGNGGNSYFGGGGQGGQAGAGTNGYGAGSGGGGASGAAAAGGGGTNGFILVTWFE